MSFARKSNFIRPIGRPISGLHRLDVCNAVAEERSLYLLCKRQLPGDAVKSPNDSVFSIQQVDLNADALHSYQFYKEEPNVSLDGLLFCHGQLVNLRNKRELLMNEASPLVSVPIPFKKVPIEYFEDLLLNPHHKEKLDKGQLVLTNGPDSIIFIAMISIFWVDLSQTIANLSQTQQRATEIPLCGVSQPQQVSAMCYLSSARELLVACVLEDRELSTIYMYSYSHEKGLELTRTAGSMWSLVDNLQLLHCGHLVLTARSHSEGCFQKPACNRNYTELVACNPMCGSSGCVQLGVCACLYSEHSLQCWILSKNDSALAIFSPDNVTRDNEALCTSSVSYIAHTNNTHTDSVILHKYAVRTLNFSHIPSNHLS